MMGKEKVNAVLMAECFEYAREILGKYNETEPSPTKLDIMKVALVLFEDATRPESVELIGVLEVREGADRSYPHCDETGCLQRQGGGLYCKRVECDTRNIFVDYAGSLREDPKPGEEPAADDVAKQRWVVGEDGRAGTHIYDAEGNCIAWVMRDCRFAKVMAAAPEMLDALKLVERRGVLSRVQRNTRNCDIITATFNPDQWRVVTDALGKAERGDSE